MKTNQSGSCILIIIIISSVILLYYTNLWQSITLMQNITIYKYQNEKHFRLTRSLYKYGLYLCINNFDMLISNFNNSKQKINSINIYNGSWPENSKEYTGNLKLNYIDNEKIEVEAKIIRNINSDLQTVKAILYKEEFIDISNKNKKNLKFTIIQWKTN